MSSEAQILETPNPNPVTGRVGDRVLVTAQMLEIGRVPSDPLPLTSSGLIVLTGRGPEDSNGSGKTTVNQALAVLLGDRAYKTHTGPGLRAITTLLWSPDVAGQRTGAYATAEHGYVIGVFVTDPEDAPAEEAMIDPVSVWVRINRHRDEKVPYLQVRAVEGLHLAAGAGAEQRLRAANAFWKATAKLPTWSGQNYAAELYGDSPRCLAWLPRRGELPPVASLLGTELARLTPEAAGEAIIEMLGMSPSLGHEKKGREKVAEQEKVKDDLERAISEREEGAHTTRAEIDHRRRADKFLAKARTLWDLRIARAFVLAASRQAERDEEASRLIGPIEDVESEVQSKQAGVNRLPARIKQASVSVERFNAHHVEARQQRLTDLVADHRQASKALQEATEELAVVTETARAADDRRLAVHEAAVEAGRRELARIEGDLIQAEQAEQRAQEAVQAVVEGAGGPAGPALQVLRDRLGIDAVLLADAIEVVEDQRERWEALLWPWRDAIVLSAGNLRKAVRALANHPGTMLVGSDQPADLPAEVTACPAAAASLVAALANGGATTDVQRGVTVVAGVDSWTGREARRRAAEQQLSDARNEVTALRRQIHHAEGEFRAAVDALEAATARDRREELTRVLPGLRKREGELGRDVERLRERLRSAQSRYGTARDRLGQLRGSLTEARRQLQEAESKLAALRRRRAIATHPTYRTSVHYWAAQLCEPDTDPARRREFAAEAAEVVLAGCDTDDVNLSPTSLRLKAYEQLDAAFRSVGVEPTTFADHPQGPEGLDTLLLQDLMTRRRSTPSASDAAVRDRARKVLADGQAVTDDDVTDVDGWVIGEAADDETVSVFPELAAALAVWLDDRRARDDLTLELLEEQEEKDTHALTVVETTLEQQRKQQGLDQETVIDTVESALADLSRQLDEIHTEVKFGARLHWDRYVPAGPTEQLRWGISVQTRRAPDAPFIDVRRGLNDAEIRVLAAHLVCALVLASRNAHGKVLILDEIGDSLGWVNLQHVFVAFQTLAEQHGVTVVATCQDRTTEEGAQVCKQVIELVRLNPSAPKASPFRTWRPTSVSDEVERWLAEGRKDRWDIE